MTIKTRTIAVDLPQLLLSCPHAKLEIYPVRTSQGVYYECTLTSIANNKIFLFRVKPIKDGPTVLMKKYDEDSRELHDLVTYLEDMQVPYLLPLSETPS